MTSTKKLFWIWYTTVDIPRGLAVIEAETPGEAINTLKQNVIVTRCQELNPGSDITLYRRMLDPQQHEFSGTDLNSCFFCHRPHSAHSIAEVPSPSEPQARVKLMPDPAGRTCPVCADDLGETIPLDSNGTCHGCGNNYGKAVGQ